MLEQRNQQTEGSDPSTERLWQMMEKTLNEATVEQRRRRRWGIFFKGLTFLYLLFILGAIFQITSGKNDPYRFDENGQLLDAYTAVVQLNGVIAADSDASGDRLITALRRAYKDPKAKGIILRINSGGGSPVQSGYVYDEINRLRTLYPEKKLYSVIMEIGASGAYYIASATDEIYADKASLVGSIGVTGASFGFVDTMDKLGVERRLYTSGEHKAFLDPFMPMRDDETEFWKEVLGGVHEQFIDVVKKGRGDRLDVEGNPDLFSGLIWNGEQALEMGLIDGLGSAGYVAREIIGAPHLVDFTVEEDGFSKVLKRLGASAGAEIRSKLTEFNWQ